ncbi:formate-dependent nitrite reductase complex subunit NrfG [compost metagenome]
MQNGLNFNHWKFITILSFVSFLAISGAEAQTSAQKKPAKSTPVDEFALFEEDEGKPAPATTPKTPAKTDTAASTKPAAKAETSEQAIERLKGEIRKNPKNISLITQLAEEFYKANDYQKTTLLLWKQVDKLDRMGLILLAKAHERRNEASEMIRALNIQIGKDAKDFEAHSLLGNAFVMQKKSKEALEAYKTALELNAKYEPAYLGIATIYEKRNPPNWYELRIIYQDMIDNLGSRPLYLSKLCEINSKDNTNEAAITSCKDAILKDGTIADNHVYLGMAQKNIGDLDAATVTLKKAADRFPQSELAQYQYGKTLEDKKNYIDAMKVYKVGTEADPKSARAWLGLAMTSFEIRKYEVALEAYRRACKFDSKNAVAFRRATTALRNTRNAEWIDRFESASENCTFN